MTILMTFAMLLQATTAAPAVSDWRVAPLAVGRWRYGAVAGGSQAAWIDGAGSVQLTISCALASRRVVITRTGGGVPLTVSATGATRLLTFPSLVPTDPLLDQLAFSRGRFAVAAPGAALLVVPSWPEPFRAIEDCRR